jgi:hypothetical protein
MDKTAIDRFFQHYGDTFARYDATAVADLYAYPGFALSEAGRITLLTIESRAQWTAQVQKLCDLYRAIDARTARVLKLVATELSPAVHQAAVCWGLDDGRGERLYEFDATYTLAQLDEGLKIVVVISHNEPLRYRACVERLRAARR